MVSRYRRARKWGYQRGQSPFGDSPRRAGTVPKGDCPRWRPGDLLLLEAQRAAVDAEALPVRPGPVVEHVAQVPAARRAHDLGALHEQAVVRAQLDGRGHGGLREARPAGPRVELRVAREQLGVAAG